jgi:ABC-type transport system involved in multi-copper enzyme maturation permease subunit
MMDLLTFEWRRARSIRTTWITSFFVIASAVGFAYLGTLAFTDVADVPVAAPTTTILSDSIIGNPIAIVLLASLGAMAFGHEYRYGTIRLTLTAFPRRAGVFFAKFTMTVVIALVVTASSVAAGYGLLLLTGNLTPGGQSWMTMAWQTATFALTFALLAFGITVLTRNHPLGIVGPLLLSILESALIGLLGSRFEWLPDVLPLSALQSWFIGEDVARSMGVWGAWMLVVLASGFVLLKRRDA